jgi:hypothetical protein
VRLPRAAAPPAQAAPLTTPLTAPVVLRPVSPQAPPPAIPTTGPFDADVDYLADEPVTGPLPPLAGPPSTPDGRAGNLGRAAATTAALVGLALLLVTLPLWVLLFRTFGQADPAPVATVMGLSMMLLGALLAGAAAWVLLVEMRCRIRLVETLARRADPTVSPYADPAEPDPLQDVLRASAQLPAQIAVLSVALTLFISATILSLS